MIEFYPLGQLRYDQKWFMKRNPIDVKSGTKGIVAHDKGVIKGMLVFDSWTKNSCQVHIAIDSPMILRHGLLEEGFNYVFRTANRGILYGLTPADNIKAIKFNEHVGFVELYRLKDAHKVGVDLVIQEVRRENYYGQISTRAA